MDKETWARCKRAYQITVNGCGKDCLECERKACLCDNRKIKSAAKRWIKQKERERQFYKENRAKRLQAAKDWYNLHKKRTDPWAALRLKPSILDALPDSFSYNEAAKAWLVEYSSAVERIKRLISKGLLEKKQVDVKKRYVRKMVILIKIKQEAL